MLVEPYLKCYRNKEFSMLDALGVGMADSDLFMRLTAYLILPVLLLFIKVHIVNLRCLEYNPPAL